MIAGHRGGPQVQLDGGVPVARPLRPPSRASIQPVARTLAEPAESLTVSPSSTR